MKILAIGANGVIGKAVIQKLQAHGQHQVIEVGHSQGELRVDIENLDSIKTLFDEVGNIDAIICMAGDGQMGSVLEMPEQGFKAVLNSKVMGQVNLVREGLKHLNDGGVITLTSGQAANNPMPGTSAISMGVASINAFIRCVALELDGTKRINSVSPGFVKETMEMLGMDSKTGIAADDVAGFYEKSIFGQENGTVFDAIPCAKLS